MAVFDEIPIEKRQEIISVLEKRGAKLPCPRCGKQEFTLLGGYFAHPLQNNLKSFSLTSAPVPTVVTVCKNCGFLSEHALGALNLLKEPQ